MRQLATTSARFLTVWLALAGLGPLVASAADAAVPPAPAAPLTVEEPAPSGLRDLVKQFDFEEHFGALLPNNWNKPPGTWLPAYTRGQFDSAVFHSPSTSFRFDMDGGDCIYEFSNTRLPISTAYDYCLEGWIRSRGLRHSRATLGLWFNDQLGRLIAGSRVTTPALGGDRDWTPVRVYLSPLGDRDGRPFATIPRYIDLSMEVRGAQAQDIGAKVWFDDLRLYRIPRLRMKLAEGRVLFRQGESIMVDVTADALLSGALPGRLTVHDDRRRPVLALDETITAAEGLTASRRITLPPLGPGVYHLSFDAAGTRPTVLRQSLSLAVLAPPCSPAGLIGAGFGLADIGEINDEKLLSELVAALGVRTLKVPLWSPASTPEDLKIGHPRTSRLMSLLGRRPMRFIGVFGRPPQHLLPAPQDPSAGILDLLAQKEEVWQQALGFVVSRYGGELTAWQIGDDDDTSLLRLQRQPRLLEPATGMLRRLTASAPVGLPWPALYELPRTLPQIDFLSMTITPEIMPDQITDYLAPAGAPAQGGPAATPAGRGQPQFHLTLDPLSRRGHDPDGRLFDLVSRVLAAKRAGVREIFFNRLIDPEVGLMSSPRQPSELFLVSRTLCDLLGSTKFAGTLPLGHQLSALVFERTDGAEILAIWNEDYQAPISEPLYLGESLEQVDLFGNRHPVPRVDSVSVLTLRDLPVFIIGIDPQISRTRRSFQLRGGAVEAAFRRHDSTIEFTNGFNRPISGRLRLQGPRGWNINPNVVKFSLAEGEHLVQPLTITVPYNETVGMKEITADFTIDAKSNYRFVAVAPLRFEMLSARTSAVAYQEGGNLVIEQEITCTATVPTNFQSYIQIPGRPMFNQFISGLKPGERIVKRYEMPYTPGLDGKAALVGVREDTMNRGFANVLVLLGQMVQPQPQRRATDPIVQYPRGM